MSIVELLEEFKPEPDALLREISKHVDDDMLERISIADYGDDTGEHMAALRQVRDNGTFPTEIHWYPAEVLELIRWSEPEDPEWKPGNTGVFGHWMRAFSCAALLRATRDPWNYGDGLGTDSTLVQLVLSLCALPTDFASQAVRSLAWLLLNSDPEGTDGQICAYGLGVFWFALHHRPRFRDEALSSLARWIFKRADEIYESPSSALRRADAVADGYPPRIGDGLREMVVHCLKQKSWETLALKFVNIDLEDRSTDLRKLVEAVSEHILGIDEIEPLGFRV
jgi:hypothetical protein